MSEEKQRKLAFVRSLHTKSDGCFTFKHGMSAVIAGVNAPRDCPKAKQNPERAIIDVQVYERCGYEQGARRTELEEFIKSAVEWVVLSNEYPRGLVNVCTQIIKDDGSIEAVTVNSAMCALLQSGVDMKGIVVGVCAAGIRNDDDMTYRIILDPDSSINARWKVFTVWDVNMGSLVTMKMEGKCTDIQLKETLDMTKGLAKKLLSTIKKIIEKQYSH